MSLNDWHFGKDNAAQWPLDAQGEREKAVLLREMFDSPADTDMVISLLGAYGIPCFKYYDKDGGAGKIINGFSGYGVSLYVPESRLEEANELAEAKPLEEDEQ